MWTDDGRLPSGISDLPIFIQILIYGMMGLVSLFALYPWAGAKWRDTEVPISFSSRFIGTLMAWVGLLTIGRVLPLSFIAVIVVLIIAVPLSYRRDKRIAERNARSRGKD